MVRSTPDTAEERHAETTPAPAASPATDHGPRTTDPAPRRHRGRRWFFRLFLTALVLLAVFAVVIQLVLWSNLPKRLVLAQLQSQLGLRVQAASLTTGWLGDTNLRDVTLALPMSEQSFLDMPRMRVKHTTLFGLLLRRPVSVDLIGLENPTLYVRRDSAGRWNLAEVAELIARAGGKKPADEAAQQSRPKLPEVVIDRATVVVQDYGGRRAEIKPLNLHGRPDPQTPGILWRYDMEVPDHVKFVGQLAPGAPWAHEVKFSIDRIDEWVRPWVKQFPPDARVAARWRGEVDGAGRLNARLVLEEAKAANMAAKGVVTVSDEGGGVFALRPDGLLLTTPQKLLPEAKVASGLIAVDAKGFRAERVMLAAVGGQMRLDGNYATATATGQLAAEWTDVVTGAVTHSGSLQGTLTAPFPERPKLDVTLTTRGTTPDGPFDVKLVVDGNGRRGWADMDWTVTTPDLEWRGNYPLSLDGTVANLETRENPTTHERVVRLAALRNPSYRVESSGEFNLTTQEWKLAFNLGGIPMPGDESSRAAAGATAAKGAAADASAGPTSMPAGATAGPGPIAAANAADLRAEQENAKAKAPPRLSLALDVRGNADHVRVEHFILRGAEAEFAADGYYYYHRPSPVDLHWTGKHVPPRRKENDRPPVYGYITGEGSIKGTAFEPRNLAIEGHVDGQDVSIKGRALKDITAKVTGKVVGDRAELKTEQFEFLKSHWSMDALYTKDTRSVRVGISVPDLDLKEAGDLFRTVDTNTRDAAKKGELDPPLLAGTLDGRWTIDCARPSLDRVRADGRFTARDVRAKGFAADLVEGTTTMENGLLTVGPLTMRRAITRKQDGAEAKVDGHGTTTVRVDTEDLSQLIISLDLTSWPVQLGKSAWVDVSAKTTKMVIDVAAKPDVAQHILPGKSVVGDLTLSANLTYDGKALGDAKFLGQFLGREADIREIKLNTLDGKLSGNAVVALERPLEARVTLQWQDVRSARLVELFPGLKGLEGTFSGSTRIQPSVDPRALGPLAVAIELNAEGGRYRTIQIGRTRLLAYADLNRFVLNDPGDLPSVMEVAGGEMQLWGRVSYHDLQTTKDAVSSQMIVHFKGLDLDQIVRAAAPNYTNGVGRLDGTLTIIGATRGPRLKPLPPGMPKLSFAEKLATAFTVEGQVKLTEARLGRLPIFSFIYDALKLGQDVKQNAGHGEVSIRMENGALELNNLRYFNSGTEVRGLLTIEQVWKMPDSPIHGNAAASARPLSSLALPFISEADRVLALLQNDLLSFDIGGTLRNPVPRQILLKDLGRGLKTILLGEVKNVKGDARRTSR